MYSTMDAWKHLTGNILGYIFDIIANELDNRRTLYQCQLTCKNWSEQAQKRLYEYISIDDHEKFLKLLATLCLTGSNLAKFVKGFEIWFNEDLLYLVLLRCSNIEVLQGKLEGEGGILEAIRQACERGGCKHLQRVIGSQNTEIELDQRVHLNTMYDIRSSLCDLFMYENYIVPSSLTSQPLLQNLNIFPALRVLTIKIDNVKTFYHIGKYITICRNLDQLKLYGHSGMNTTEDVFLDTHSTDTCPAIKHLCLVEIPTTKQILEHVMHAFPNLDNLVMVQAPGLEYYDDTIPNSLWLRFLAFIHNIKADAHIHTHATDIIGLLLDYFYTRKLNTHVCLLYEDVKLPYMNIKNIKDQAGNQDLSITLCFPLTYEKNGISFEQLLRRVGGLLNSLTFIAGTSYKEFNQNLLLDVICQRCPLLEKLELSLLAFAESNVQMKKNNWIKALTLDRCILPTESFTELSTLLPSLSNLNLKNCSRINTDNDCTNPQNLAIKISHTPFDTLDWVWCDQNRKFSNINLRIDTSKKSYCYFSNQTGVLIASSCVSFQKFWDDSTVLSLHIQCQEIKNLYITFEGLYWSIKKLNVLSK